jgi:hypothetical protein
MKPLIAERLGRGVLLGLILLGIPSSQRVHAQAVKVVDVIPRTFDWEQMDNSEPSLAVRDGTHLAVSAHVFDHRWCIGVLPLWGYFVSNDGGDTWTFLCGLIRAYTPYDPTLRFSGDGATLYFGFLVLGWNSGESNALSLILNDDFANAYTIHRVIRPAYSSTERYDQPQVATFGETSSQDVVVTVAGTPTGADGNVCRIYVLVARKPVSNADFRSKCVAERTSYENPYALRIATSPSGRVFVAYLHTRNDGKGWDVVVQSGIIRSTRTPKLDDLKERVAGGGPCAEGDGLVGVRVVRCVQLSEDWLPELSFGWERPVGSELSLAVDPGLTLFMSKLSDRTVYIAWGDSAFKGAPPVTLHVRKSTDGGRTWGADLFTVPNATNPALAVDSKHRLGFLYQQLVGTSAPYRWQTRLCITTLCASPDQSILLADTPAGDTDPAHQPYLGEYVTLVAKGNSFYGAFSARNDPADVNFPSGVTYLRRCSGGLLRTDLNRAVQPSVDPFFFRVQPDKPRVVPMSTKPAC